MAASFCFFAADGILKACSPSSVLALSLQLLKRRALSTYTLDIQHTHIHMCICIYVYMYLVNWMPWLCRPTALKEDYGAPSPWNHHGPCPLRVEPQPEDNPCLGPFTQARPRPPTSELCRQGTGRMLGNGCRWPSAGLTVIKFLSDIPFPPGHWKQRWILV